LSCPGGQGKSDEHVTAKKAGGVGSDFGGEQRGQEICSVINTDGLQTSDSRDRLLSRPRSDFILQEDPNRVQCKEFMGLISASP
jgi:hypothetical protein